MKAELHQSISSDKDAGLTVLQATLYCKEVGFDEVASKMIATAASELVRNVLKYAGHGNFTMRTAKKMGNHGIEIEVVDSGPGIADCDLVMQDHYSSGGTLGLGLPAVKRIMDEFSLQSTVGEGTRVTARKWM